MPEASLEKNCCPLCGKLILRNRFKLSDYAVAYCNHCDLEFNNDFPPLATEKVSFSQNYYLDTQKEAFISQFNGGGTDPSLKFYQQGLRTIEKFTNGRSVLDVGAGLGSFMKMANDTGWEVAGLEISAFGSGFIREKYGFKVYEGDFLTADHTPGSFDVLTFWDSIEHMQFPKESLKRAYDLLKPGGVILLSTDNYNSLITYLAKLAFLVSLGKWSYPLKRVYTPYNKSYFNDRGMRNLVEETGFQVKIFKKIQYPVGKLKLNLIEKMIVKSLYSIESIFNWQSQFTIIAQRP